MGHFGAFGFGPTLSSFPISRDYRPGLFPCIFSFLAQPSRPEFGEIALSEHLLIFYSHRGNPNYFYSSAKGSSREKAEATLFFALPLQCVRIPYFLFFSALGI
jgi:hypothetical protein